MCYIVLSPSTAKLLQPSLHKHGEECIEQNEGEAEEAEHVHHGHIRGDLKGGRNECSGGGVAELL